MPESARKFGRGLNSLRVRFTLMMALSVTIGSLLISAGYEYADHDLPAFHYLVVALATFCLSVMAGAITYFMTGKLTRPIENLRASTLAIANGDYNAAVQVECNCEVGGLADSFKAMVNRLNANVSKIQTLAYEDGVTGLPNRAVLIEALQRIEECGGALLFIDLDNFKQVNDLYGHQVGDQLLRMAAARIEEQGLSIAPSTVSDCLVRLGGDRGAEGECRMLFRFAGDEFVALVGGEVTREALAEIAEDIIDCLAAPFESDGYSMTVGCSVGIAILGEHTHTGEDLTKLADLAMYEAKAAGKGTYCFFDEKMRTASIERAQVEADLLQAFQRHEFVLHYQPKFCIRTGVLAGVEALVRWQHPERGLLNPGDFLRIAEEKNLMEALGFEVFRMAALQLRAWKAADRIIPVSVNVCPTQFLNPNFGAQLIDLCRKIGVEPKLFTLEITETAAMSGDSFVRDQIHSLEAAGFRISIDDFGVGYSNLSKLYQLPFDDLKLDKSMIDDIVTDLAARRVVEYTIGMAHGLGHPVVAEGVEDPEQMEVLAELGCDFLQGYYLCKPISAGALEEYMVRTGMDFAA